MKTTTKNFRDSSTFYLNGSIVEVVGSDNFMMVADWVRKKRGLTGTKIVCAEGDCGACTVLVFDPSIKPTCFVPINSCICLVAQLDGKSVITVEGLSLGNQNSKLPNAFVKSHASQCGYCTPGFVMTVAGMIEECSVQNEALPVSLKKCQNYLTGNLCRCTGYTPIIEAACEASKTKMNFDQFSSSKIVSALKKACKNERFIDAPGFPVFYSPISLTHAVQFAKKHAKNLKILGSTTDLGVQYNKGTPLPEVFLDLKKILELQTIKFKKDRIFVGAQVSLSRIREALKDQSPEMVKLLNIFASPQIKNTATLVGNIANASPIGDTLPYLLIADCEVEVAFLKSGKLSKKIIPLEEFYLSYKKTALQPGDLIVGVSFHLENPLHNTKVYKVSSRKDLDISCVNAAFSCQFKSTPKGSVIENFKIALGGVAATPVRLSHLEHKINGKALSEDFINDTSDQLLKTIKPLSDHRGSAEYRQIVVKNLYADFFRHHMNPQPITK